MTNPIVTVIVPTFGRPRYLEQALNSVVLQTFQQWECIVVDDGSGDDIQLPNDARFRLIRREHNGGPAAARNSGLEAARGLYVAFLDDDDLLTPIRIQAGLAAGRGKPDAITTIELLRFDHEGLDYQDWAFRGPRAQARRYRTQFPSGGQVLTPKSRVQFFDESLRTAEDADWWIRVAGDGPLRSSPVLGYLVRRHPEVRPSVDQETTFMNRVRVYEKHEGYMRQHRRARSFAAGRIASSAHLLGAPRETATWAKRSLSAFPTLHAVRVLALSRRRRQPSQLERLGDESN